MIRTFIVYDPAPFEFEIDWILYGKADLFEVDLFEVKEPGR